MSFPPPLTIAAVLALAALVGCAGKEEPQTPAPPLLGKQGLVLSAWKSASPDPQDRLLLAHAMAKGKTEARIMVATQIGSAPSVAAAIAALGGDIQARYDEVGYLRVRLPLERLAEISALPDVLMAHIDGGGPHGLYANDRDLIEYPLTHRPAAAADQEQVAHGGAAHTLVDDPHLDELSADEPNLARGITLGALEFQPGAAQLQSTASLLGANSDSERMSEGVQQASIANGRFTAPDAAVPGAQFLRVQAEPTLSGDIEGLLRAAADPRVDLITRVQSGGRFPEGGEDLFALMADRAIEVHGKPLLSSAGDAGRAESINGASSGRRVLAIGGYGNAEIYRRHFDFKMPIEEMVAAWSSRGPAADGGAKPDLLAGDMPAAAGAAASLMAAARAENLPADARHISWALRMGARRLQNYQAHEQGLGLIDVARALELLRQQQAQQFELPDILTRAPVKTSLARFLPEPEVGQGLYEREGWLVGQKDTRTLTLIRQNGAAAPLGYSLQWRGNDGTFATSSREVVLPLNVPVPVPIEIAPEHAGIHSAHLLLIDKSSDLPVHAVMATVVASEQFTAANGYTIRHREQSLPGLRSKSYFLEVPPNVASLRVDLSVAAGQVEMLLDTGGPRGAGFNLAPATNFVTAGKPAVVLVPNPPPGVYELALLPFGLSKQFTRTQYRIPSNIEVSASIHYVDTKLDERSSDKHQATLWMDNIYAPLQRSSVVAEIGARRMLDDAAGPGGMRAYNINVATGSSSLRVAVSPADNRARMGIYLYDCAADSCKLWGGDVFTRTLEKKLVVPNPRAGLWKVVIDAGTAGTAFQYTEIMTNGRFGAAKVASEDAARRTGARWHQQVSYQVSAPPPFGYELVGIMDVTDPGSEAQERAAPYGDWEGRNRPLRLATRVMPLADDAEKSAP